MPGECSGAGRGARAPRVLAAWLVIVAVALVPAATASAQPFQDLPPTGSAGARVITFERAGLSEASGINVLEGTLSTTAERAFEGVRSAKATYNGSGSNGFARTIHAVDWSTGEDIWYGGSFFIPSKTASPCWWSPMRWDNYSLYERGGETGGVEIDNGRARLFLSNYTGNYVALSGDFDVPVNRWFRLDVHQTFSNVDGRALNEVFLDGVQAGGSATANTRGRAVTHMRYGIVALRPDCSPPSTLYFDRAWLSGKPVPPIHGPPPVSEGTPKQTAPARVPRIAAAAMRLRGRLVRVRMSCRASEAGATTITGKLALTAVPRRPQRGKRVRLGSSSFECAAPGTATVALRLRKGSRWLARRRKRMYVAVTPTVKPSASGQVRARRFLLRRGHDRDWVFQRL